MFRKSTISDKYGWWMGQNFCHPVGNFRHLLRTGEKWCNDLLLGGEAPSKLRLRWRGSHIDDGIYFPFHSCIDDIICFRIKAFVVSIGVNKSIETFLYQFDPFGETLFISSLKSDCKINTVISMMPYQQMTSF